MDRHTRDALRRRAGRPEGVIPNTEEVVLMKLLVGWCRWAVLGLCVVSLGLFWAPTPRGYAQTPKILRVGLAEDPDILDPTLARTFVGRIVFASLCDKLYDIDANLNIVPQLAASLPQLAGDGKTLTIALRQG